MASEPPPKAPPVGQVQLDEANASLAAIPPDLRGNSWLTLSELSIVSGVPEPTLAIVTKNWGLRPPPSLQIETTKVQMVKAGPYTWFYRPFAADTTLSSNKMQGAKERMENQANMSKYLLSFLKGGTRPTPETMPAAAPQGATWVRPNERCRLSTEACQPLPPSSSSSLSSASAPQEQKAPTFPRDADGYVVIPCSDGSISYAQFDPETFAEVELCVVFSKPACIVCRG